VLLNIRLSAFTNGCVTGMARIANPRQRALRSVTTPLNDRLPLPVVDFLLFGVHLFKYYQCAAHVGFGS
jgi:hypothetical protein